MPLRKCNQLSNGIYLPQVTNLSLEEYIQCCSEHCSIILIVVVVVVLLQQHALSYRMEFVLCLHKEAERTLPNQPVNVCYDCHMHRKSFKWML